MSGQLREETLSILEEGSDQRTEVSSMLDDIESRVIDIQEKLQISSVDDLSQIAEAAELAEKLADDLY